MSRLVAITFALAFFLPGRVWACAVCFGAKGDPQTEGLNMAIITLLGTTYTLFAGMIAVGIVVWRRSKRISATEAPAPEMPETRHG